MANYKIILSYDGTDYFGWQRQPKGRTIQGTLEETLTRLAGTKVDVAGAGRTDAGVHALGQAASFKAEFRLGDAELFKALNGILPPDIRVLTLERVPAGFHARRDARGKIYQYRIVTGKAISPFDVRYALHWPYPLNVGKMRTAAGLFAREADFSGFSSNKELSPVRRIVRSELRKHGDELIFTIEASGFLRYMVRTIVGTLLEAGRGKIGPEDIERVFRTKTRTLANPTAPAKGLCLIKVFY
ncbi:MAG: tRNA pseudouridine(38-40) synthase TruA [Candidatus Aminicenantes bacterium]|nr:tRNA pseudouridine(38-40) synthase TruA [Candidatus Aminicenantes bacterium]